MMSLYIEKGEPTRIGWKRLHFYLVELYNPDWTKPFPEDPNENFRSPHDHEFFTFTEISKQQIRVLNKVKVVK